MVPQQHLLQRQSNTEFPLRPAAVQLCLTSKHSVLFADVDVSAHRSRRTPPQLKAGESGDSTGKLGGFAVRHLRHDSAALPLHCRCRCCILWRWWPSFHLTFFWSYLLWRGERLHTRVKSRNSLLEVRGMVLQGVREPQGGAY